MNETVVYPIISCGSLVGDLDRQSCLDKLLEQTMIYYLGVYKFQPIPVLYSELGWVNLPIHFK